ncbi:hypothetical protein ACJX0J_030943, partial [Zea mays]
MVVLAAIERWMHSSRSISLVHYHTTYVLSFLFEKSCAKSERDREGIYGEGLAQDPVHAKRWLPLAADCGHKKALYEDVILESFSGLHLGIYPLQYNLLKVVSPFPSCMTKFTAADTTL